MAFCGDKIWSTVTWDKPWILLCTCIDNKINKQLMVYDSKLFIYIVCCLTSSENKFANKRWHYDWPIGRSLDCQTKQWYFSFKRTINDHSTQTVACWLLAVREEFEDTKGVIRIPISKKSRQHNGQKKKYKRTNNELQNIHIKLKIE